MARIATYDECFRPPGHRGTLALVAAGRQCEEGTSMPDEGTVQVGREIHRERERVFAVAVALISLSILGFILASIFQWPSDFVLGDEPDSKVTLGDVVNGTVTSIPLAPFLVLVICALLVRSVRWWGTAAAVVLTLLGALFIVGGLGEVTSENENVPRAVLVVAGALYALLGLTLLLSGVLALVAQWRGARFVAGRRDSRAAN